MRRAGRAVAAAALLVALGAQAPVQAGGGASRTLVVVNGRSPTSLRVGRAYAALRGIPDGHLMRLDRVPPRGRTTIELLRERVLAPLQAHLLAHGLDLSIDTIAFSTDIPYAADHSTDGAGAVGDDRVPRVASLTGLAFLLPRVLERDMGYTKMDANVYADVGFGEPGESRGYRSTYLFARGGKVDRSPDPERLASAMDRHRLAMLLGWHGTQGMAVPEILAHLERCAAADGTKPEGTVYLMDHPDVRAATRKPFFARTIEALEARGRKAVVLAHGAEGEDGVLPRGKDDVLGCCAGIASFDWPASGSTMRPGAFAEHLTSFGAQLDGSGQTKCIEFLRAGAAGSSGTVAEPLSIWQKFPAPHVHVHYADGCSLAEAWYLSTMGPYQTLVVGDPLCRPFATFVPVEVDGLPTGPWQGEVPLLPRVPEGTPAPAAFEAYVDGRHVATAAPGEPLVVDAAALEGGAHVLEVAAVEASAIETRSERALPFVVAPAGPGPTLSGPRRPVPQEDEIALSGTVPAGTRTIEILSGHDVLASLDARGTRYKTTLRAAALGEGRSTLVARAVDEAGKGVRSAALDVVVAAPTRSKPKRGKDAAARAGLAAEGRSRDGKAFEAVVAALGTRGAERLADALAAKAPGGVASVVLRGQVAAAVDGTYQLAMAGRGRVVVRVHGKVAFDEVLEPDVAAYVEVGLLAGRHPIEIEHEPAAEAPPDLSVEWGGAIVPRTLGGDLVWH